MLVTIISGGCYKIFEVRKLDILSYRRTAFTKYCYPTIGFRIIKTL